MKSELQLQAEKCAKLWIEYEKLREARDAATTAFNEKNDECHAAESIYFDMCRGVIRAAEAELGFEEAFRYPAPGGKRLKATA